MHTAIENTEIEQNIQQISKITLKRSTLRALLVSVRLNAKKKLDIGKPVRCSITLPHNICYYSFKKAPQNLFQMPVH
jgi:hypothetical protein